MPESDPGCAVCVDFGSTFTKTALVDLAEGRIVASASHPTTIGTDVLDGYDACLAALVQQDPRAAEAEVLACSSAGGGLRMDRHCDNAERVVAFLSGHPSVSEVIYPGLPEHPGHDVASKQMKRFGGMVSFRCAGGEEQALAVCDKAEVFTLGESLGGVESLIEHPGRMTHASVAGTDLEVPGDLIRLSVGIETADDLIADLDRALG